MKPIIYVILVIVHVRVTSISIIHTVNAVKSGLYVDLDDTVTSRNCDFTKIRLPVTVSSIFHPKEIL
jgi:hypothetical protein